VFFVGRSIPLHGPGPSQIYLEAKKTAPVPVIGGQVATPALVFLARSGVGRPTVDEEAIRPPSPNVPPFCPALVCCSK
jgi:hypothetical protein